jgi:hypothetical protein
MKTKNFETKKIDRMMLYVHRDRGHMTPQPCIGEHFVSNCTLAEAKTHTLKTRVRSAFAKKPVYFDRNIQPGGLIDCEIYDVSEIAKKHKRFKEHGKIDDVIGNAVGRRGTDIGQEYHDMTFEQANTRIKEIIKNSDQPMDKLMLSEWQFEDLIETINAIQHGHAQRTSIEFKVKFDRKNKAFTVLAELCPRYGKTIWAATVAEQLGYKVTVVASYVLTSFYSFIKEFDWYEQFRHFVLVDSKDQDYKTQVTSAVKSGKQVILFVSMCNGEKRGERINFVFKSISSPILLIVDEADYGAHRAKQTIPFINAVRKQDTVILMTGTGGEKACGLWTIDYTVSRTYVELLMIREEYLKKHKKAA